MSDAQMWQSVLDRDAGADGRFVYAVTSTGIYCRPSCASRRPKRTNVRFYGLPEAAEQAGFRACKRCRPRDEAAGDPQLARVREACQVIARQLEDGFDGPPSLDDLAAAVGGSPHHLQRTFTRLIGISPAAYADALRMARLRGALKEGNGVSGAIYEAGYGAASRVYERAAEHLGMTPASYARGGRGAEIAYTIAVSPLGPLLVAATNSGVCFLSLGDDAAALEAALEAELPEAELRRDDVVLADWVAAVVGYLEGRLPHPRLPLDVQGTAFQRRVWQELMEIPTGLTVSYSELARRVTGKGSGRRAVARGCATNPVAVLIPCHRVQREDGSLGGYRWGLQRKRRLLEAERRHGADTAEVAAATGTDG